MTVDMGQAVLLSPELPLPAGLGIGTEVSVGNPHAVSFVELAESIPLSLWGPAVEKSVPGGINAEFLFFLGAAVAWLRLDGLNIPQLKLPRIKRKDPAFLTGDMADHIDDDIVKFDDLDREEQDVCVLLTDLFLAVVCLALALIL